MVWGPERAARLWMGSLVYETEFPFPVSNWLCPERAISPQPDTLSLLFLMFIYLAVLGL